MNIEELPFKTGMQYENWEFDLEPVEFDGNNVKYRYLKHDIPTVIGETVEAIYLYFNFDILYRLEVVFSSADKLNTFTHILSGLGATWGEQVISTGENLSYIYVIWKLDNFSLRLVYKFDLDRVYLKIES